METVGQLVQEAVDFMNGGSYKFAFPPTARAVEATIQKISGKEVLSDDDYKRFIKENWELLVFIGMPRALPLPLSVPFGLKRIVPQFNVHHGVEEIILLLINQSLRLGKFPPGFEFDSNDVFEIKKGKLFLPLSLVSGLLGSVIFHPANETEEIGEKYWMNISDFKMFISELWGRRDLAERIMKFYQERD